MFQNYLISISVVEDLAQSMYSMLREIALRRAGNTGKTGRDKRSQELSQQVAPGGHARRVLWRAKGFTLCYVQL